MSVESVEEGVVSRDREGQARGRYVICRKRRLLLAPEHRSTNDWCAACPINGSISTWTLTQASDATISRPQIIYVYDKNGIGAAKKANSEMKLANIKEFYPRLLSQLSSKQIDLGDLSFANMGHISWLM